MPCPRRAAVCDDLSSTAAPRASAQYGCRFLDDRAKRVRPPLSSQRTASAAEIGAQLLDRRGAAQHDVGPRLRQHGGERQRVERAVAAAARPRRGAGGCAAKSGAWLRSVSRPLASASLTITPRPAVVRLAQRRRRPSARAGSTSPARCRRPAGRRSAPPGRGASVSACRGPLSDRPIGDALVAQPRQPFEHGAVVEHAALQRRRVDLVQVEMRPEPARGSRRAGAAGWPASAP